MKCRIPAKPPTEAEEARLKKKMSREYDRIIRFAGQLQVLSMRDNFGYGNKRFAKFSEDTYQLGRDYIDRYTVDGEPDEDYAVTSYYAMLRDLCDWGWDPELHLWRDSEFDGYPADKNSASARLQWAARLECARAVSFYCREMFCIMALYLRSEHGFAQERLARAMVPVRDAYLGVMRQYMRCSAEGDAEMVRILEETRKRYNDLGYFKPDRR